MKGKKNPFIVSGKIEPEYFCDRASESARLIKSLTNGNNLVLISPRRMGKTGLIQYCYDKEPFNGNYHTIFIDILHTTSLREFTFLFGKSIFEAILPLGQKMLTSFVHTLKSLSGKFSIERDALKKMIEDYGGKNVSSISSKTDYVLAGDNMGPEKRKKAETLGIPIISEDDFYKMIGKNETDSAIAEDDKTENEQLSLF